MEQKNKRNISWIILAVLIGLVFGFAFIFVLQIRNYNHITEDLNDIEYLSSSTQRVIKLLLDERDTGKALEDLDRQVVDYMTPNQENSLYVLKNQEIALQIADVVSTWDDVVGILGEEEIDFDDLFLAGENHYYKVTDLTMLIQTYGTKIAKRVVLTEMTLLILLISVGVIIGNNLFQTEVELRRSRILADVALIDTTTGLYNRSKCQELFRSNTKPGEQRNAIIVFDLNDLKKANDVYGHRIGDELISSFAKVLKEACEVHFLKPFIGRYGGDEFVVLYENVQGEEDVFLYLKELSYHTEKFNHTESRFQLSYATGYSVNYVELSQQLTLRQLFDLADAAMYVNKEEMKKAMKEAMDNPL